MGICVHAVERQVYLPDGSKLIAGSFTLGSSYATGGETLNLSNYFSNARLVVVPSASNGWSMQFNAAAFTTDLASGTIIAKSVAGNVIATPIVFEANSTMNMVTVNVPFLAIGQPK